MKTVAEVRNSDNAILQYRVVEDTFVPPAHKFGPSFASRIVPAVENPAPVNDPAVFENTAAWVVTANQVTRTWTPVRRTNAVILQAIEDEAVNRINGMRGILVLLRYPAIQNPTAAQTNRFNRLQSILAFAESLAGTAGSLTTVTGAAWPA